MSGIKIEGPKNCPVLIAAELVGLKYDFTEAPEMNFTTPEGECLCANAALRYIARMRPDLQLYGRTFVEMAVVDGWLDFSNMVKCYSMHSERVPCCLKKAEARLVKTTFLAGERLSIADIAVAVRLFKFAPESVTADLPCVTRWMKTILGQPAVMKFVGAADKFSGASPACCKKEKKCEQAADKKCEKAADKKCDAPEGKKALTSEELEAQVEAEQKAAASAVNPLDLLPATTMNMDEWKRCYSNTKDLKGVAMPWFWQNLDKAGYSVWFMKYDKMEGENTVGFTTANMLGGFLQRLDGKFRKYSFGVINVIGESGSFDIQGVWLLRGQEIPAEIKEHPSFEYHTFRKLDLDTEKQLIEDYWCSDESVEGRPIDSCKVWK